MITDTDTNGKWYWLRKRYLKPEANTFICATQEQTIRPNHNKYSTDTRADSEKCRVCSDKSETV